MLVFRERERPERDPLVDLHPVPDRRRLADDDARPVVDEEGAPDRRAGMDVHSRLVVRELRHHPGDQPDPHSVQLVRDPVREDRLDARVGEDQLVESLRGRVAVERGLDVLGDAVRDLGQPLEQLRDDLARVASRRRPPLGRLERLLDLRGEPEVDPEEDVPEMVAEVVPVQDRISEIPGVDDLLEEPEDLDDLLLLRPGGGLDGGELRAAFRGRDDARHRVPDPVLHRRSFPAQPARRARASSCARAASTSRPGVGASRTSASSIRRASSLFPFS